MADELNKDPGATFYKVRTLHWWFLGSVAAMTLAYVASIWQDHFREWRIYQRDFAEVERLKAIDQGAAALRAAGGAEALDKLNAEIERLQKILAADTGERPALEDALRQHQLEFNIKNAAMKEAKAIFEAERFEYEEFAHLRGEHDAFHPTDEEVQEKFAVFTSKKEDFETKDEESKAAEAAHDAAKSDLERHDALVGDVRKQLETMEREVTRFEKRADSVDPERPFSRFRNSLFFDFMVPTVTPRKIVVNEILDDLNFLKIPKVDLCTTCHLATDRNKDYPPGNAYVDFDPEKDERPEFRSHGKPELFCTSLSPHNQERFGCSGCHQGGNQRLTFAATFHTPSNETEKETWHETLDWHPVHEWDAPMLSSRFFEASCYKCHKQEVHIPGADQWNRGRDLVERFGCYGCHKMAPFDGHRKVAPPLDHVVSKFADLDWMLKWVDDPESFRPTTRMPKFFHLENRESEPGRAQAEVTALVTYLYTLATPVKLDAYPGTGDAERGKAIVGGDFGGKGCLACHNVDDFHNAAAGDQRHGPDLSGVGSKVTPDWLYTWIRDPKRMWPDTNMPSLRLTDQEAADVVAYLMTKRNPAFEAREFVRPADDAIYEQILTEKLTERMTEARAKGEIANMSGLEKRRRTGEFLLNHYGCFGCHNVPGYEDAKPIGTELNGWGSKHADRLDFGLVEMAWKDPKDFKFNRESWLAQKLGNTRFYDRGKDKKPFEKLKMPQFTLLREGMPDADREAVMTFVLSLVKSNTVASIEKHLTPAEEAVERGRHLVREKNCVGCHILYGEGGEIRKFQGEEGVAYYPPLLDGQGARTQPDWLFRFLADPAMGAGRGAKAHLRPWMKARMPTFGFSQEQLNDLVAYFAHEEVWHTSVDRALWDEVANRYKADFPGYDERAMRNAPGGKQQLYQALVARLYKRQGGRFLHEVDWPYLNLPADLNAQDHAVARKAFEETLVCVQCHAPGGLVPKGKTEADMAPDLRYAHARLAPTWVMHWFEGPGLYQPGTRMPNFWALDHGVRGSAVEAIGDPAQEMQLIRDYLYSSQFASDYEEIAQKAFNLPPKNN